MRLTWCALVVSNSKAARSAGLTLQQGMECHHTLMHKYNKFLQQECIIQQQELWHNNL